MTTTITIELSTENPDATWHDVLKCINAALTPSEKSLRLKDTMKGPFATNNQYRFETNGGEDGSYYNGVRGTSVLHIEPDVPTGLGAVVKAGRGPIDTLYTRVETGNWVSSVTGRSYSDKTIKGFLRNGATVLFEGVEQ